MQVRRDSFNIKPPFFRPGHPCYPPLAQVVQVTSPGDANNVYGGFVEQWNGAFRTREPCKVWEPNGIKMGPGHYPIARLIGSYLNLPLYAVGLACCVPVGAFSSISSSPSSPSSSSLSK